MSGLEMWVNENWNEEYKSKNRHNVEWFFEGVLYLFSLVIQF